MVLIMLYYSDEVVPFKIIRADDYEIFKSEEFDPKYPGEVRNEGEYLMKYIVKNEVFFIRGWNYYKVMDLDEVYNEEKVVKAIQKLEEELGI